jgi:tetratricopeptide (TPR) repeat protein
MDRRFAAGILLGILPFFCAPLWGQTQQGGAALTVRVVYSDDRPVSHQIKVELSTGSGTFVNQAFTDSSGTAYFRALAPGSYQLRVSGQDAEDTSGANFLIQRGEFNHFEQVRVKRLASASADSSSGPPALVDVSELNVPKDARKSFDKGLEAFKENRLDQAIAQLEKAIGFHSNYASAYNLLGMTRMRQGQLEQGRAAFEKAIAINGNFALASRNLAKIYCNEQKLGECETLLQKSAAADPRNAETLTILAQLEFMKGKYEEASTNARRVHELPHKDYAVAHLVAARALRAINQQQAAMEEYKLFLKEAPESKSSPQARQELVQLEGQKP